MRAPCTILVLAVFTGLTALAHVAKADDPFPFFAVVFLNSPSCPAGWEPLTDANNRLLVPMASGIAHQVPPGPSAGFSQHVHRFGATLGIPGVSYALGPLGCLNNCVVAAGDYPFTGEAAAAGPDLPVVNLLPCLKDDDSGGGTLPSGLMAYFYRPKSCPSHWTQVIAASGRIVVGLPAGGTAGATFGGPALSPDEDRKHTHHISGTLTTVVQPVAAASGGAAGGYGANGTYSYSGISEASSSFQPYFQLLLCSKD
jgi:hypothetical protein